MLRAWRVRKDAFVDHVIGYCHEFERKRYRILNASTKVNSWQVQGSNSGVAEDSSLLWFYAMLLHECLLTFWRFIVPLSLGSSCLRWAVVQEDYLYYVGTADKGGEPVGFIVMYFRQGLFALPGIFIAQVRGWEWRSRSMYMIRKCMCGWSGVVLLLTQWNTEIVYLGGCIELWNIVGWFWWGGA